MTPKEAFLRQKQGQEQMQQLVETFYTTVVESRFCQSLDWGLYSLELNLTWADLIPHLHQDCTTLSPNTQDQLLDEFVVQLEKKAKLQGFVIFRRVCGRTHVFKICLPTIAEPA